MLLNICVILFFVLLIIGVPIVLSLGVPGAVWILFSSTPLMMFGQKMYSTCNNFAMLAIPFFMLAGQIMERTDITQRIVDFANACIGWVRGGLAQTVELSGILLAGLSGSSNADTSALGVLCYKPLIKSGYNEGMANAVVVSAGSIGPVIPPSICMIIYANAAGLNIAKLFMAGIIPGLLMGVGYMIVCYIYARKYNVPMVKFAGFKNIWRMFKKAVWALLMPVILVGGIISGVFTVTECGVAAVVYGIVYGFIVKKLTWKTLWECCRAAMHASVVPLALICVSTVFSYMLAREGVITQIAEFCTTNISGQLGFLFFVSAICMASGCFVEGTAVMLLLTPLFLPVAIELGINAVHFSIVFLLSLTTGGMTPPVGSQLFVMSAISKTPITKMVKPISLFILVYVIVITSIIFIPGLATLIPGLI